MREGKITIKNSDEDKMIYHLKLVILTKTQNQQTY